MVGAPHYLQRSMMSLTEALSLAGLEATSVGNHEFDKGMGELLRKQTVVATQQLAAKVQLSLKADFNT